LLKASLDEQMVAAIVEGALVEGVLGEVDFPNHCLDPEAASVALVHHMKADY
jgi:hypothetical protein